MNHFSNATIRIAAVAISLMSQASIGITPAAAAATYDGVWKVQISSSRAACGGHNVSIDIANGKVASNSMMVTASGRVAEAGNISVTLKAGSKQANGSGRLSGTSGTGTWSGSDCTGTWTAQRI